MVIAALVGVAVGVVGSRILHKVETVEVAAPVPEASVQAPTPVKVRVLDELWSISSDELEKMDLAHVNLLCAQGLPRRANAEFSLDECLRQFDRMVEQVRRETARNIHQFDENPADFDHSEPFFRVAMMNTILGEDFGVRYNPEKVASPSLSNLQDSSFYQDADDVFLTGLLAGEKLGTCASMPVLIAAVGRRLGYPLKLVAAKAHLFVRWDDGTTRVNFECTNGVSMQSDEHYRQWPFPISGEEVEAGLYLKSLTAHEELAAFLSIRSQVEARHRRVIDALGTLAHVNRLHPLHPDYEVQLAFVCRDWMGEIGLLGSAGSQPPMQFHPSTDPFAEVRAIQAHNQSFLRPDPTPRPGMPSSDMNPGTPFPSGWSSPPQPSPFSRPTQPNPFPR